MCHICNLNAQNAADAGAFRNFASLVDAQRAGFYSVDTLDHMEKRAAQRAEGAFLDRMYFNVGLDRAQCYTDIAAEIESGLTGGVWARSSSEYAKRCASMDAWVLELASEKEIEL